MLHTGTMFAVIAFFRDRWKEQCFSSTDRFKQFALLVIWATLLTGIVGEVIKKVIEKTLFRGAEKAEIEQVFSHLELIAPGLGRCRNGDPSSGLVRETSDHGSCQLGREEFLAEAIALAPKGVVSLLIDSPQHRPGFKPAPNPILVTQQVVDLRRGLDLLLVRPDIDKSRIAYIGHSWNAGNGAILDAIDKKFAAFVFMGGPQSTME